MGKVYLVGAGPGDPDLMTVKALRLLQQATVIIYDRLVSAEILALGNPAAVYIDGGKQQGQQEEIQRDIYRWLLKTARTHDTVVRLKSGDPMVFGRGGEELEFLYQHGISAEVVPGVSSAVAAPALAGIPLTYRGVAASFAVIAGHRQSLMELDWSVYMAVDTLVVLMGVENRELIADSLIRKGRPRTQPVAFIERSSTDRERIVEATLESVARGNVDVSAPAVFVIGEVVGLRVPSLEAAGEVVACL